jgi:hypothetical protein
MSDYIAIEFAQSGKTPIRVRADLTSDSESDVGLCVLGAAAARLGLPDDSRIADVLRALIGEMVDQAFENVEVKPLGGAA